MKEKIIEILQQEPMPVIHKSILEEKANKILEEVKSANKSELKEILELLRDIHSEVISLRK